MQKIQSANLYFYCRDPTVESPYLPGKFYPVSLDRIRGIPNPDARGECAYSFDGSNFIFPVEESPRSKAFTITSAPITGPFNDTFYDQYRCTWSNEYWSDIVMQSILTLTENGNMATFWQRPSFLGKQNWNELVNFNPEPGQNLEQLDNTMTVVILHEFMHTILIPKPIGIPSLLIYCVFSHESWFWS